MKDYLEDIEFELELIKQLLCFVPQHMQKVLDEHTIIYKDIGTQEDKRLKNILHYYLNIKQVLYDLDITIMFFNKNRDLILKHYPKLKFQKEYYIYHYENYYIRLITLTDIIGKLGILIYSLDIEVEKGNAYNFKSKGGN